MIKDYKVIFEVGLTKKELNDFWEDKDILINQSNTTNIQVINSNDNSLKTFINELKYNKNVNFKKGLENRVNIDYVIERLEEISNGR